LKWLQQTKHKRWLVSMLQVLSLLWQGPFVFGMIQHPTAIEADARKDAKEADTQARVSCPSLFQLEMKSTTQLVLDADQLILDAIDILLDML
jgi:hypothetical protein